MAKKVKSLELPEDSIYKLTKVKAVNKNSFIISQGQSCTGELQSNPIKLGERCIVVRTMSDAIYTSAVQEIKVNKNNSKITLVTENSIYELVEINEAGNT